MASNFEIHSERHNGLLLMRLKGDLDGSSAHVLLRALRRSQPHEERIVVDVSGLKHVHAFGRNILECNLPALRGRSGEIIFSDEISPQR